MKLLRKLSTLSRKKKALVFLPFVLLGIVCALTFSRKEEEPSYNGKSLSEWLQVLGDTDVRAPDPSPDVRQAKEAIVHIATNRLSRMVEQIATPDKKSPGMLSSLVYRVPLVGDKLFEKSVEPQRLADDATGIFYIIGEQGSAAVPELTKVLLTASDLGVRARAAYCLLSVGEPALPSVISALTNPLPEVQFAVVELLSSPRTWRFGTNTGTLHSVLIRLSKENSDVGRCSVRALGKLKLKPAESVPALVNALASKNERIRYEALWALARFGERDAIRIAFNDQSENIRSTATNLLLLNNPKP